MSKLLSEFRKPVLKFSVREYLRDLNLSVDKIAEKVSHNFDYGEVLFDHSISAKNSQLSNVEWAIISIEDGKFFRHTGVDWVSLPRTFARLIRGKKVGGISTIDQQVVRIATGRFERTFSRKVAEIILVLAINTRLSKRAIFDYYIHHSYFGYKMEGCEVASRTIFGRPAADLQGHQAVFLACLLPLPMPKAVYERLIIDAVFLRKDIDQALLELEGEAPRWGRRVAWRYNNAIRHQVRLKSRLIR